MRLLRLDRLSSVAAGLLLLTWTAAAAGSPQATKPAGLLSVPRLSAKAVLLENGKVLIAGGQGPWSWSAIALTVQPTAELYDPTTNRFSSTGSMHTGRVGHTATLLKDGRVLIVGGVNATYARVSSAELYDPRTGSFTVTGDLNQAREGHTASLLPDGTVLIVGGWWAQGREPSAEIYDPATGQFHFAGTTTIPRVAHAAVVMSDGRVLIVGGDVSDRAPAIPTNSVEIFDPATGAFAPAGNMLRARWAPLAVLLGDGRMFIAGGWGGDPSDTEFTTEIFDPTTGSFQAGPRMSTQMVFLGTATLLGDGTVAVAGGFLDGDEFLGATSALRIFDPVSNTFRDATMLQPRVEHTATLLRDGRLLLAGGSEGTAASVSNGAELYGEPTARHRRSVGRH